MAKGLRSKIKRRFRAIKRKTIFAPVEDARTFRLASKLSQTADVSKRPKQQLNGTTPSDSFTAETPHDPQLQLTSEINSSENIVPIDMLETTQDVSATMMEVDIPKISTHGPRTSRNYLKKMRSKGIIIKGKKLIRKRKNNVLIHFRK
ncbi:hypothetical protein F8M41_011296 [Gigaspora margarita]|uniref:DUF2423 domain-containing protein n=1 Tax=Gigaspora margarita TaxID=4874 RepID=A0A8H4A2L5_GIGMA|nr:hypothetical protein F8M41_011296 [Gigaspora margarita]